jgi:hypothetical protein
MTKFNEVSMQEGSFLPHHSILKESNVTRKLRVVFDASAKTTSGVSLNDTLLTGPIVQQDLFTIVTRFRKHNVVFTANIKKKYRQVFIHTKDRHFQRILWRNNPEKAVRIYEFYTITYGMSPAPYLATRTLIQLCKDERRNYPRTSEIITRNIYVDDLLTGAKTLEQAIELKKQITNLLNSFGFELRKWAFNHPYIIEPMAEEHSKEHWCLDFTETHKTMRIL